MRNRTTELLLRSILRPVFRGGVIGTFLLFPIVAPAQSIGEYEARISQLEQQLREITNQNEQLSFGLSQLNERFERMSRDIDLRLSDLEQGKGAAKSASASTASQSKPVTSPAPVTSETKTSPAPAAVPVPAAGTKGTPQEQYQQAFALVSQSNFVEAEAALKNFIQSHPKDPLAGNAQYWLAETYYARGEYEQASKSFLAGYQSYPKSAKAPDCLLKLGLSLRQLGKTKEACTSFNQLDNQYPNMSSEIRRRMVSERQRLGCS